MTDRVSLLTLLQRTQICTLTPTCALHNIKKTRILGIFFVSSLHKCLTH